MRVLGFVLLALGVIGILISMLLLGFAALGYLGALADVSVAENREMGRQLLFYLGLPSLIGGAALCAVALLALLRSRRRADASRRG